MNIAVCVKQVLDASKVRYSTTEGQLVSDEATAMLNPADAPAIELAVRLKEAQGGQVTLFSLGGVDSAQSLKGALAFGADAAILCNDPIFSAHAGDADMIAHVLAAAIRHGGPFDLVLCGEASLDMQRGEVGPRLAELLDVASTTNALDLQVADDGLHVRRRAEGGKETLLLALPALVAVARDAVTPRSVSPIQMMKAMRKPIAHLDAATLGLTNLGQEDATPVRGMEPARRRLRPEIITGRSAQEVASVAVGKLLERQVI